MAPHTIADVVNADCVHIIWLDALCLVLVMFNVHSWSFYEWRIVCLWPGDKFDVFFVFVSKATTTFRWKCVIFVFPDLQGSADTLVRRGGKLYHLTIACFLRNIPAKNY